MNSTVRKPVFLLAALFSIVLVCLAYSRHFDNPFEFDDSHTIVNNMAIRDLKNIPSFFTDATTTSSLPANQAYRPGLTTLNAIDYALGNTETPEPFVFHVHIFIGFLLLGILLFFFFLHVFEKASPGRTFNAWLALFGASWFWLHAANAETVNYVIARSDTASTVWILVTFVTYIYWENARRFLLFLIPMMIAFFIKEPGLIFAPLLLVYEWLFGKLNFRMLGRIGIVFLFAGILFLISRALTPAVWTSGGEDRWAYLMTQPFVIVHYFNNFILPVNLAVDTDWTLIRNPFDDRVLTGIMFILALLFIAWRSSRKQSSKPVTFGILWFFLALAPTSSLIPFSEVLNDHRVFFPYIGLVMAFTCGIGLAYEKAMAWFATDKSASQTPTYFFSLGAGALLLLHTAGTYHRCEIWDSGYSLWKECAEKCPNNGRGMMNYGNEVVALGRKAVEESNTLRKNKDMAGADRLLQRSDSLFKVADSIYTVAKGLWPEYSYIYINIAVLNEWQNKLPEAETNFRKAIELRTDNPECYYHLADFYVRRNRASEAIPYINQGLSLSPGHEGLLRLRGILDKGIVTVNPVEMARLTAEKDSTPENFLNLSLQYYNSGQYEKCAEAANVALQLRPDYVEAYNNICSAMDKLGEWDKAVEAGEKGMKLNPEYALLRNNLNSALQNREKYGKMESIAAANPSAPVYLDLSLKYYQAGIYRKCIAMAEKALQLQPDYADAYNNICAAWNMIGDHDKAIAAAEAALRINPDYELAKNNLAEAKRLKQQKSGGAK